MIPQDGEPIEGNWIKSDGQSLEFEAGGDFSNQIYPGSTWSLDGKILTMTSTVQIIDDNQLITKLIVQTVDVSFSDDENAMWWVWDSVTIDNVPQELDENSCSLLLKTSLAKNTYEFGINAPNYESDKPAILTRNNQVIRLLHSRLVTPEIAASRVRNMMVKRSNASVIF